MKVHNEKKVSLCRINSNQKHPPLTKKRILIQQSVLVNLNAQSNLDEHSLSDVNDKLPLFNSCQLPAYLKSHCG